MTDNSPPRPSPVVTVVAIALIVVFVGALGLLAGMRADKNWDRLVYLLGGLEALVFSGAGVLFGASVQRAQAVTARKDAEQARTDAQQARTERDKALRAGEAGRALHAAVATKAERERQEDRLGGRPDDEGGPTSDLAELAELAERLFS